MSDDPVKVFIDAINNQPTHNDPVPSQRRVVSELAILVEHCPTCNVGPRKICKNPDGSKLMPELQSLEMPFHHERIIAAIRTQITENMAGGLTAGERMLIVYYAFVLMADSLAANSERFFSRKYNSAELQACFAQSAVTELVRDKMIVDPMEAVNAHYSRIVKPS